MVSNKVWIIFLAVLSTSQVKCNFWGLFDIDYIFDSLISDDSDEPKSVDSNESVDQSEIFIRDIIDLANRYHIVPVKPDSTKPIEKGTEPSISASSSSASTKIPETTSEHTSSNILLPKPVDAPTKNPAVTESPSINEKISEE